MDIDKANDNAYIQFQQDNKKQIKYFLATEVAGSEAPASPTEIHAPMKLGQVIDTEKTESRAF